MMKPRPILLALLLCLVVALPAAAAPPADPQPGAETSRPNILFVYFDDLLPTFGTYGGQAVTTNLDRLAAEGMRFTNTQANAVSCNPSRLSMLLSLRPSTTGITSLSPEHVDWRTFLADPASPGYQHFGPGVSQIKTLFQHFRDQGYYVANAGKSFHSNEQLLVEPWDRLHLWKFWHPQGIRWPQNIPLSGLTEYYSKVTIDTDWGAIESAQNPNPGPPNYSEATLPDTDTGNNGVSILSNLPADRPFFVAVGFVLPHLPWYVPQRLLDRYPFDAVQTPPVIANDLADIPPEGVALVWQDGNFWDQQYIFDHPEEWKRAIAHSLAGATYADEQLGRLLAVLDQRGLADNTIVVIWSDHGFHLGQKQHLQKHTLWEISTRVPLIIKAPGVTTPGASTNAVVNSTDLFPTLVELAGLTMPTDFHRDGRSLAPLLRDPAAYWPWPGTTALGRYNANQVDRAAIRTRGWSYIRYNLLQPAAPQEELYFRAGDPNEWTNLLSPLNGDPATYRGVRLHLESILRGQMLPDAPPTAPNTSVTAWSGLSTAIPLAGADPNQDYLAFSLTTLPAHGRLFSSPDGIRPGPQITQPGPVIPASPGWTAYLLYRPDPGALTDSLGFTVSDGIGTAAGSVNISVQTATLHPLSLPLVTRP